VVNSADLAIKECYFIVVFYVTQLYLLRTMPVFYIGKIIFKDEHLNDKWIFKMQRYTWVKGFLLNFKMQKISVFSH